MRLLLVRHGITSHNIEGLYTGQADIPLTALGELQAAAVGKRLSSEKIDAIVASDLQRARHTAGAIAHYHSLPVEEDLRIREVALGQWQERSFAEILTTYPEMVARRQTDATYAPPGGESFEQLRDRAVSALEQWQSRYPDGTVLWATHAGVIGVMICHLLDIDLKHRRKFRYQNTSITEFEITQNGGTLVCLNDTAHLRSLTVANSA